ncbi:alpha/beta fold hydrolase [Dactylosporangium sp. AC04546]|uniref:alpha/beta fold hydrolase n=1 Tax=Dactylosporangium sp. AC04546 TaxID=2862460 RepID=UPI001EDE7720|nr:alpha/beta fold hydrolase [Dactylosporangium sp. AC04546]WVK87853.1 alpha/beta fold hydrolase [Dactylosporangium sp. AC04546]
MDIILVPGLWLDGTVWERVTPALEKAGHHPVPLTLPGMTHDADRTAITLHDHVEAVVSAIDAASSSVVLVGHSAGAGIAHAALDARPSRVAHAVYVGGFPTPHGEPIADDFPSEAGNVPMPDWSAFDESELAGLTPQLRETLRALAIPSPAGVLSDRQHLHDPARYDVPVTAVSTDFTSATLRGWIEQGLPPVREYAHIRTVHHVDLPAGHWPQLTRPEDLAAVIAAAAAS